MPAPDFRMEWRLAPAEDALLWFRHGWAIHGFTRAELPDAVPSESTGARHPLRDVVILRRPLVLRDDVLPIGKDSKFAPSRFERGSRRSAAWSDGSNDCASSSLKWTLLTAYDRLLRAVSLGAVGLAIWANNRRKGLLAAQAANEDADISPEERAALLQLGFEPVP